MNVAEPVKELVADACSSAGVWSLFLFVAKVEFNEVD